MIRSNILIMAPPPRDNQHNLNEAANEDSDLPERCITYIKNPYDVLRPNGVLPSDMIRPLLDQATSSKQNMILKDGIYYRVKALEREHLDETTGRIQGFMESKDELLSLLSRLPTARA